MFQQIADGIRAAIASGVYRAGEAIPSVRVQAQALRINANTVQRAYEELQRDGVLETRPGLGLFVTTGAEAQARSGVERSTRAGFAGVLEMAARAGLSAAEVERAFAAAQRDVLQRKREGQGSEARAKETRR